MNENEWVNMNECKWMKENGRMKVDKWKKWMKMNNEKEWKKMNEWKWMKENK